MLWYDIIEENRTDVSMYMRVHFQEKRTLQPRRSTRQISACRAGRLAQRGQVRFGRRSLPRFAGSNWSGEFSRQPAIVSWVSLRGHGSHEKSWVVRGRSSSWTRRGTGHLWRIGGTLISERNQQPSMQLWQRHTTTANARKESCQDHSSATTPTSTNASQSGASPLSDWSLRHFHMVTLSEPSTHSSHTGRTVPTQPSNSPRIVNLEFSVIQSNP